MQFHEKIVRHKSFTFLIKWTTIHGLSMAPVVIISFIAAFFVAWKEEVYNLCFFIIFVTLLSFIQWILLRKRLRSSGWWIGATVLGCVSMYVLYGMILKDGIHVRKLTQILVNYIHHGYPCISRYDLFVKVLTLCANSFCVIDNCVIGIMIGGLQWLVFRRCYVNAGFWIMAMIANAFVFDCIWLNILKSWHGWPVDLLYWTLFGFFLGLCTGIPLVWLFLHPTENLS